MIICLCKGLCEKKLAKVIDAGATTVREVGKRCGAGTDCGSCKRHIAEMIDERAIEDRAQDAPEPCYVLASCMEA